MGNWICVSSVCFLFGLINRPRERMFVSLVVVLCSFEGILMKVYSRCAAPLVLSLGSFFEGNELMETPWKNRGRMHILTSPVVSSLR